MHCRRTRNLMNQYISEIIRNKLVALKSLYSKDYGPIYTWTEKQRDIFFLNCDVEIEKTLTFYGIHPLNDCNDIGLSYGIMVLQTTSINQFLIEHKIKKMSDLNDENKHKLNKFINAVITDYIINGLGKECI